MYVNEIKYSKMVGEYVELLISRLFKLKQYFIFILHF